jgi:hypothetical protein
MSDLPEEPSPGWDAIDRALAPLYAGVTPKHFGTMISHRLGGPDPLEGISAYPRSDPLPHWHFVTYGFTELFEKETDDPAVNGFGFELTFRLVREPAEAEPPRWALNFLQNLARYVFDTGNRFARGHYLNCNGPIALEASTALEAIVLGADPELGEFSCAHGRAEFLQVIGITADEELAIKSWNADRVLQLISARIPWGCTDLRRRSILEDATALETVRQGQRDEGSKTSVLYLNGAECRVTRSLLGRSRVEFRVGAEQAETVAAVLRGRLPHGRELRLSTGNTQVCLLPAQECRASARADEIRLELTPPATEELAHLLQPREGIHQLRSFPAMSLRIKRSEIRDRDGHITNVVG